MGENDKHNEESWRIQFTYLTKQVEDLKTDYNRSDKWIREIKEAIIKLTMIQEAQQEAIIAIKDSSLKQIESQNKFLEQLVKDAKFDKETREMSMKRITIVAGIISTIVAAIGTIVVALITQRG